MIKIEDFENAPVGATATHPEGARAMKIDDGEQSWITQTGLHVSNEHVWGLVYTLDSFEPSPASTREAVELAWELAHEVKEGQVIPVGTWLVDRRDNKIIEEKNTFFNIAVDEWGTENIRTAEPLPDPEPEPDWHDAPAVLARLDERDRDELEVFIPTGAPNRWTRANTDSTFHWNELRDVTPLWPK